MNYFNVLGVVLAISTVALNTITEVPIFSVSLFYLTLLGVFILITGIIYRII